MLNLIATWRRERETIRVLSRLSDRDLADVGFSRRDLPAVAKRAVGEAVRGGSLDTMIPSWAAQNRRSLAR